MPSYWQAGSPPPQSEGGGGVWKRDTSSLQQGLAQYAGAGSTARRGLRALPMNCNLVAALGRRYEWNRELPCGQWGELSDLWLGNCGRDGA